MAISKHRLQAEVGKTSKRAKRLQEQGFTDEEIAFALCTTQHWVSIFTGKTRRPA